MSLPLITSGQNTSVGAGVTVYASLGITESKNAVITEVQTQIKYQLADTLSKLRINVYGNDRGASTLKLRINGGNGTQSVAIGSSTTGIIEATGTDTIAVGDLVNLQLNVGTGGTTFTAIAMGVLSANRVQIFGRNLAPANITTNNATNYYSWAEISTTTTEAQFALPMQGAGTASHFGIYVPANAKGVSCTMTSRVNSAAGNGTITIGAGVTGLLVDDTHSDVLQVSDTYNYAVAFGADSNAVQICLSYAHFIPATDVMSFLMNRNGTSVTAGTAKYPVCGSGNVTGTESDVYMTAGVPMTALSGQINIRSNGAGVSGEWSLRIAGTSVLALTVGVGVTGILSVTGNAAASATDTLAMQYTNTDAGTVTLNWMVSGWTGVRVWGRTIVLQAVNRAATY